MKNKNNRFKDLRILLTVGILFSCFTVNAQNPLQSVIDDLRNMFGSLTPPANNPDFLYDFSYHSTDTIYLDSVCQDTVTSEIFWSQYQDFWYMQYDTVQRTKTEDLINQAAQHGFAKVPLGIMHWDYLRVKDSAMNTGLFFNFDIPNTRFLDKTNPISTPYKKKNFFMGAPLFPEVKSRKVEYLIDPNYLLFDDAHNANYNGSGTTDFYIDFGDGNGWQLIDPTVTAAYPITYNSPGKKIIRFSHVFPGTPANSNNYINFSIGFINIKFIFKGEGDYADPDQEITRNGLNIGIFNSETCNSPEDVKKVIVLEGWDPMDFWPIFNTPSGAIYQQIVDVPRIKILEDFNYEYHVISWQNSQKSIVENAAYLAAYLDELYCNRTNDHPFVVLGHSMGGLVGRFALTAMENGFSNSNCGMPGNFTRLFISLDAPHQGANVSMGLQQFYADYHSRYTVKGINPLKYLIDKYLSDVFLYAQSPKEMLINHVSAPNSIGPTDDRIQFLNQLQAVGNYPQHTKLVALSNGSLNGRPQVNRITLNPRIDNDLLASFQLKSFVILFKEQFKITELDIEMFTNPGSSTATVYTRQLKLFIPIPKLSFFKLSWTSWTLPISFNTVGSSALGLCNEAGSPFGINLQEYSGEKVLFGTTNTEVVVGAGIKLDYNAIGLATCFIPVKSALDFGNVTAAPLSPNYQTNPTQTAIDFENNCPFDVIAGIWDLDTSSNKPADFYSWNRSHANVENSILKQRVDDRANTIYYERCKPIRYFPRYFLNQEIGDEELYLENLNWNASNTSIFEAEKQIYVNERNPFYRYNGFVDPDLELRGVYSKAADFTSNSFSILKSDFNFAIAEGFPQGFQANPPFTNWGYEPNELENCCTDNLHLYRKGNFDELSQLENASNKSSLLVYPNPAKDVVFLKLINIQADEELVIQIYNLYGQQVFFKQQVTRSKNITLPLNLNDNLLSGIYIIRCTQASQTLESKLIID